MLSDYCLSLYTTSSLVGLHGLNNKVQSVSLLIRLVSHNPIGLSIKLYRVLNHGPDLIDDRCD